VNGEVKERVASAKVKAIWVFDYMLLSKKNGKWIIDKVFWQIHTVDEQNEYCRKLKDI